MGRLSSVLRAIGLGALVENPIRPDFGAEFGGDYPRTPPYDPENAMEAGAAFSWLPLWPAHLGVPPAPRRT